MKFPKLDSSAVRRKRELDGKLVAADQVHLQGRKVFFSPAWSRFELRLCVLRALDASPTLLPLRLEG